MKNKRLGYLLAFIFLGLTAGLVYGFIHANIKYNLAFSDKIAIYPVNPVEINPYGLVYEIKQGGVIQDSVKVKNTTKETAKILFRSVDVVDGYVPGDEWLPKAPNDEQIGIGKWLKLEKEQETITLLPEEEYIKNFTITIPEDAPYGEYWGLVGADVMPSEYENSEEGGVHIVYQLGLRTQIKVTDEPRQLAPFDLSESGERFNSMIWAKYGFLMGITTCVAIVIIIFLQLIDPKK